MTWAKRDHDTSGERIQNDGSTAHFLSKSWIMYRVFDGAFCLPWHKPKIEDEDLAWAVAVSGISRICSVDQERFHLFDAKDWAFHHFALWCVPLLPSVPGMLPSCQAARCVLGVNHLGGHGYPLALPFVLAAASVRFARAAATAASACVTRTDWLKLFEGLTGLDLALYRGTNKSVLRVQTTAYSVAVLCLASGSARNITKSWIYAGGVVFWGMPVRMVCGCVGLRQYGNKDYCSLKIEKQFTDKLLVPSTTARLLPTRHGCRNRNSELFRALLH